MKTLKLLCAALAAVTMTFTAQAAKTAKVVVAEGGKTLWFVYDDGYYGTEGTGWFSVAEAEAQSPSSNPPWYVKSDTVEKVIFKPSFANYKPTHCGNWFSGFSKLKTFEGLENFDTSAATSLAYMFLGCSSLTSLDVTGFDTSKVTDMEYMFYNCSSLATIVADARFVTTAVESSADMFGGCTALVGGNGTLFDGTKTDKSYARIDIPGRKGYFTLPRSAKALLENGRKTLRFVFDNESTVADKEGETWFSVAKAEGQNPYNDQPWVTVCGTVTKVVFDPSFADYRPAHCGCWFYNYARLETVEGLANLDTSAATSLAYMFFGCSSLRSLDVSCFDTSKVTNMFKMFSGCSVLGTILASDTFVTTAVTKSSDMFSGCTALVGGKGTVFDSTKTDKTYARIDGKDGLPGYFTSAIPTLFDSFAPGAISEKGATYNGFLGEESLGGTFTLVVKKPKNGTSAATLTKIDPATGKKVKVKGTVNAATGVCGGGLAGLQLNAKGVGGSLGGAPAQGAVDGAKAKDAAALAVMNGFDKRAYGLVFADAAGEWAYLTATFSKKGKVKVAGTFRGAKVSGKAQLCVGDGLCAAPFVWSKKGVRVSFVLWFDRATRALVDVSGLGAGATLVDAGAAAAPAGGTYLAMMTEDAVLASVPAAIAQTPLVTRAAFDGKKFDAGKVAKVTYKKGVLDVNTEKGPNVSGFKLAYSKGALKGSFTVYAVTAGKLVKNKFKVAGVVVDGFGYAVGTNKKLPSIPLVLAK